MRTPIRQPVDLSLLDGRVSDIEEEEKILRQAEAILLSRLRNAGDFIGNPEAMRQFLRIKMADYEAEVFAVICLDNQHRVIDYSELFHGSIAGASVHPRVVVQHVLKHNAAAVVFAHNHPSGIATPSQSDRRITGHLKGAMDLIDVRVLDHMVVAAEEIVSFAELGYL